MRSARLGPQARTRCCCESPIFCHTACFDRARKQKACRRQNKRLLIFELFSFTPAARLSKHEIPKLAPLRPARRSRACQTSARLAATSIHVTAPFLLRQVRFQRDKHHSAIRTGLFAGTIKPRPLYFCSIVCVKCKPVARAKKSVQDARKLCSLGVDLFVQLRNGKAWVSNKGRSNL